MAEEHVPQDGMPFPCKRPDHRCPFPDAACFKQWRCLRYTSEAERKRWGAEHVPQERKAARVEIVWEEAQPLSDESDAWNWTIWLTPRKTQRRERLASSDEPMKWQTAMDLAIEALDDEFTE